MPPLDGDQEYTSASIPQPLSEQTIREIVRQEIHASGAASSFQPLLEMTPDQAMVIGTAIAFLWAAAWCFKQVANFLKEKDDDNA